MHWLTRDGNNKVKLAALYLILTHDQFINL